MLIGQSLCSDRSHFPRELEVPQETTLTVTNQKGPPEAVNRGSGAVLDATQSPDCCGLWDRAAQENSRAKQGNQDAEQWVWKAGRQEGYPPLLHALQLRA